MEKKRKSALLTVATLTFVKVAVAVTLVLAGINLYLSLMMAIRGIDMVAWEMMFLIFQIVFVAVILNFIITLTVLLHRGFGALPRMEEILNKILAGDYSLRLHLRKKDIMLPFMEKLNKVLDLLEQSKSAKG